MVVTSAKRKLAAIAEFMEYGSENITSMTDNPYPTALSPDFLVSKCVVEYARQFLLVSGCSVLFACHLCEDWVGFSSPSVLCQSSLMCIPSRILAFSNWL